MAIDPTGGHSAMDYPEHLRTYSGFLRATMILAAFVVVVLLFLLSRVLLRRRPCCGSLDGK